MRLGLERGVATGAVPEEVAAGIDPDDVDFGRWWSGAHCLDSVGIPRHGGFARFRAFVSFDELGADDDYDKLELVAARSLGRSF